MAFAKKQPEPKPEAKAVAAPQTNAEKFKSLLALSRQLDDNHKTTNSLIRLGSKVGVPIPSICTGLPTLDWEVLQTGGIPRGRVIEIFGPESAGKTTLALHIIGQEQQAGGIAAFVDAEHALDPTYAKALGVDVDNLVVNQPGFGEEALQVIESLVDSMSVTLIVVDSVAALVPEAELLGEMGDAHVGLQARLMSQAMRKLVGKCSRNNVTVIFINQIREKIGVMFGSPETTTGGRALKFYSSIRLDVRRREALGAKDNPLGHQLEVKAVKNKCGTPFLSTKLDLYYPKKSSFPGFDKIGNLVTYAEMKGVFLMTGSWYNLDLGNIDPETKKPVGVERLANGFANVVQRLRIEEKALQAVRAQLLLKMNTPTTI